MNQLSKEVKETACSKLVWEYNESAEQESKVKETACSKLGWVLYNESAEL